MAEPASEIVKAAQRGDPQALTDLILSQQHYIYSIALSVFRNPEDAADLTQEACIRLCRALPQYNGESRFTTWLYRLVVNLCRDELRRRGRQVTIITGSQDADDEYDPLSTVADDGMWGSPSRMLEDQERRNEVRRALEQLDTHYRLALTLYYFEDMKYVEIAEILDLPLNTVKSHIRRGKEHLAQLLRPSDTQASAPTQQRPRQEPSSSAGLTMALLGS